MSTRTFHLAEAPAAWVDAQVSIGKAPDADAYVAALIERDRAYAAKLAALNAALDDGEASGPSAMTVKEILAEARADVASGAY